MDLKKEILKWYISNTGAVMGMLDVEDDYRLNLLVAYHQHILSKQSLLSVDEAMEVMARHYFDHHQQAIGHAGSPMYDALSAAFTTKSERARE